MRHDWHGRELLKAKMQGPISISGLHEIVDHFDVFFVDQFGVLHDGQKPYAGVVDAIEKLHQFGKQLIILTNSGKRAEPNLKRLLEMGFSKHTLHTVVSSGEVAWRGIESANFGFPFASDSKVYIIGRHSDDYRFHDLGLHFVERPEIANFILILGSNAPITSLEEYQELLGQAANVGVPALCANPDIWMISGGGLVAAPGAIAETYKKLGGPVRHIGKPYRDIYQSALAFSSTQTKQRVIAIGDSIEHDIRGANDFAISSVLVRGGVSASLTTDELNQKYSDDGAWPNYVIPAFQW